MKELKIEKRGKYGGVKIHLDKDDCLFVLSCLSAETRPTSFDRDGFINRMGKAILRLQKEEPTLLEDRSPEEIAAILIKDHEKTGMQLQRLKEGKEWQKVDPNQLEKRLMKYVAG